MIRYGLLALGLLCPGLILAEPAVRLSGGTGQSLDPGQKVVVRFSGIPADVDEFELLLVAGTGKPFRLRLSKDMPANTASFLWTVPNLDLAEARLVLRMGGHGRETEGAMSDAFSIVASPSGAPTRLELRLGEVWVEPEPEGQRPTATESLPTADLGGASPWFDRLTERYVFIEPTSAPMLSETLSPSGLRSERSTPAARTAAFLPLSRVPLSIPARI